MLIDDRERIRRAAAGDGELELIGALLFDDSMLDIVGGMVRPEHIASESLRAIYGAVLQLRRDGRTVTSEAVASVLGASGDVVDVLCDAMAAVPHGLHADHHAKRVVDSFKQRTFGHCVVHAQNELRKPDRDTDGIIHGHIRRLESLLADAVNDSDGHIVEHLDAVDESSDSDRIPTGLFDLDVLLDGGFLPGQLICIGARPSVGKTAFCGGLALSAAQAGVPALALSCEMTGREMAGRFRAQACDTDLAGLPLFVRDAAGWSIDRVEAEARRQTRRNSVKLVVVDYLSLVRPRDARLPRWEQVADVSRSLKLLAAQAGVCVIAAQQLSRDIERRDDRRPRMADFRESGSIEQDSDILMAIDRAVRPDEGDRTEAKLYLMKNRHGETADLRLKFDPRRTLFTEAGTSLPNMP